LKGNWSKLLHKKSSLLSRVLGKNLKSLLLGLVGNGL